MRIDKYDRQNFKLTIVHGYVVFLGPVGLFLKKANDYYILFLGCMVSTKMVVGSPGIMADISYGVINMAPVKSLI